MKLAKKIIDASKTYHPHFADVRFVELITNMITVQDGRVEKVRTLRSAGFGLRVLLDGAWGFSSTNIDVTKIRPFVQDAFLLAKTAKPMAPKDSITIKTKPLREKVSSPVQVDPRTVSIKEKVNYILKFEEDARHLGEKKIANTVVNYSDIILREYIHNIDGLEVETESFRTKISIMVTARRGELLQSATEHKSGLCGFELIRNLKSEDFSKKATLRAVCLLYAKPPPAGTFSIIFDPIVTGLFTHEAIGHNTEADLVLSGQSILEGKMGQQIASPLLSIYDDPTLKGYFGSYAFDSEGSPSCRRQIVENGILKSFLHGLETSQEFGVESGGSARAANHTTRPIVRMSNTFIAPGESTLDEIIGETDDGILLKGGQWGYVLSERGQFTCNAEESFRVKNGKIVQDLRNVSVSGITLQALRDVDKVGKEWRLGLGGMCGKEGQSMFVDAGGPHIRVKNLVVGGVK